MTYRSSKSDDLCGLDAIGRIKQKSYSPYKKPTCDRSRVRPDSRPLTLLQRQMDLREWSHRRLGYIFQVSSKFVQGSRSLGGRNLSFPISLSIGFYNRLYFRLLLLVVMMM